MRQRAPRAIAPLAVALLLSALPASTFAQWSDLPADRRAPREIDERTAVSEALIASPTLRALEAGRRGAEADLFGAHAAFAPELEVSGRYTRLSELPESARALDLGVGETGRFVLPQLLDQHVGRAQLSLPVTDLLYRSARLLDAAGDRLAAQSARMEAERVRVASEARSRYVELALAEALVDALVTIEARHAVWREEVARRVAAGLSPDAGRLEVEAQWVAVRRDRLAAEARRRAARGRLALALGRSATAELRTAGLDAAESVGPASEPLASAELEALARSRRALFAMADAERIAALPSVALTFGVDVAAPHPRAFAQTQLEPLATWDAGVVVSFSLARALASVARADQLASEAEALRAEERELADRLAAERAIAESDLEITRARRAAALDATRLASDLLTVRRAEYDAGALTAADLALAEGSYLRSVVARHEADAEAQLARARLLELRAIVE